MKPTQKTSRKAPAKRTRTTKRECAVPSLAEMDRKIAAAKDQLEQVVGRELAKPGALDGLKTATPIHDAMDEYIAAVSARALREAIAKSVSGRVK